MIETRPAMETGYLEDVRAAQLVWAAKPLRERLKLVRRLRRRIAADAKRLAESVPQRLPGSLSRSVADTLASEVLPLLEACRFLEREAEQILQTRNLGSEGRPVWLGKVEARVERVPWGVVLVLGASNYPLFLAGVQALQALAAGNAVLWKPAPGTEGVVWNLRLLLLDCGLESDLLRVLDSDVESATQAIADGVDYVVLTGSAATGKAVLRQLAETLIPATMELSGCDAVFVLPGADLSHAITRLVFGMRFNGSFTCMAPRRVFLIGFSDAQADGFARQLAFELEKLPATTVDAPTFEVLRDLIEDADLYGAAVVLNGITSGVVEERAVGVTLISRANATMHCMQTEIFAPILSVMRVANVEEALEANRNCEYGLTASIFGPQKDARVLATRLRVGNVLINDVIVSTADPRISFGGRGASGFGVTRGAEGLLGMTTPKTIQSRKGKPGREYQPTGKDHVEFFAGLAALLHGGGIRVRLDGLKRMVDAARKLK